MVDRHFRHSRTQQSSPWAGCSNAANEPASRVGRIKPPFAQPREGGLGGCERSESMCLQEPGFGIRHSRFVRAGNRESRDSGVANRESRIGIGKSRRRSWQIGISVIRGHSEAPHGPDVATPRTSQLSRVGRLKPPFAQPREGGLDAARSQTAVGRDRPGSYESRISNAESRLLRMPNLESRLSAGRRFDSPAIPRTATPVSRARRPCHVIPTTLAA